MFAGHSLGGGVALLCTLDLLHSLGDAANPNLACVGFATPAVGNAALVEHAMAKGWDKFITNYLVPGQCTPGTCLAQAASLSKDVNECSVTQTHSLSHLLSCTKTTPCERLGCPVQPASVTVTVTPSENNNVRVVLLQHMSNPHFSGFSQGLIG